MQMTHNEIKKIIYILISRHFEVAPIAIQDNETLENAFGADSLDIMELINSIEENLPVKIPETDLYLIMPNATPNSLIAYCEKHIQNIDIKPVQQKNNLFARIIQKLKNRTK